MPAARSKELSRRFFQELVANAHVPMYVIRPSDAFRFVYVNEAAARHFGRTQEELLELAIVDVDPNATLDGCERFLKKIRVVRSAAFQTVHTRPDGETVPVEIVAGLIDSDGDEVILGHVTDLTERVARAKLEADLRERQRTESLAAMASTVAHDFNNLLVGILANVAHAASVVTNSAAREALDDAESAARDAAELCRQLLAFSGEGRFVTEVVSLEKIVEDSRVLVSRAVSKHHALSFRSSETNAPVDVQIQQIQQVLINLVRNASEALGEREGNIVVSCGTETLDAAALGAVRAATDARPGPFAYLEVADDGPGIDSHVVGHVFEPFFSTRKVGRGIGLSAVLGVVQGHGGAIRIATQRGAGTTVRAWFPLASRYPQTPAGKAHRGSRRIVLVVDDEPPIQRAVRRILERAGFQVEVASEGVQALSLIAAGLEPSCVLLDLTMPGLGGRETLERIRGMRPGVPVVLTSGFDAGGGATPATMHGAVAFLPKPFGPRELTNVIEGALGSSQGG